MSYALGRVAHRGRSVLVTGVACSALIASSVLVTAPVAAQDEAASQIGEACLTDFQGSSLNIGFSAHPLADALISQIGAFEELTGITLNYEMAPEADFRAKLNTQLQAGSGGPDIFMTGPATNWQYSANGWIEDLQPYIDDPALTSEAWDFDDFYQAAVDVNRWTGESFGGAGEGPLWALPLNEEGYSITYRTDVFADAGLEPPNTTDELIAAAAALDGYEFEGQELDGIVARGIDNWGILVTGYGSFLFAYGGTDLNEDGTSAVNSPEAIAATEKWAELMQYAPQDVASYDWQQVQSAFAAGTAAMILDADHMSAVFEDPEQSQVAGKVGYVLPPEGPAGRASGIWLWSLGMNAGSENKDAAWCFIQWATSADVMEATVPFGNINPTRKSVAASDTMVEYTADWGDYNAVWQENLDKYAAWRWNPSQDFGEVGNRWASAVQEVILGQSSAEDALNRAAEDINRVIESSR